MNIVRETDDENDPFSEEENSDNEEEQEDPLADLEPEVAEKVRGMIREREQAAQVAARTQLRENLQGIGLDLTDENLPAMRDPAKLGGWTGASGLQPPPPPPRVAPAPEPEPDDGTIPDPVMDAPAYERWFQKRIEKELKPYREALTAAHQRSAETIVEITMAKVPGALANTRFADLLTHPEFEPRMRQALAGIDPEQFKQQQALVRIAGMIAIDLDGTAPPPKAAPRDESGRFVDARAAGRQALARATLPQTGPSRDAGRTPRGSEPSDIDRAIAERLGISAEEAALLRQDTTGDASAAIRQKRLEKQRGRTR